MNDIDKLIAKYENELRDMTVMDDYDGGTANQLRKVIDDLRELHTTKFSKDWYEKECMEKYGRHWTTEKGGRK